MKQVRKAEDILLLLRKVEILIIQGKTVLLSAFLISICFFLFMAYIKNISSS
jgi:hypothetical protein